MRNNLNVICLERQDFLHLPKESKVIKNLHCYYEDFPTVMKHFTKGMTMIGVGHVLIE